MQCPKCGYLMSSLDAECVRCAKMDASQPSLTPDTPPQIKASAVPQTSSKTKGCCLGCVGTIVGVFAILWIWGSLITPQPSYFPAAGYLSVGRTLYYQDHKKHGVIIAATQDKIVIKNNGGTDPAKILVDQGDGVVMWEDSVVAGRVFLMGINIPKEE